MRLFHFTCADHGYRNLGKRGELKPNYHPFLLASLVWLTTNGNPTPDEVGLTMDNLRCDRLAYRYIVTDPAWCIPWIGSPWRHLARAFVLRDLERFGDPSTWWVAEHPVPVRLG